MKAGLFVVGCPVAGTTAVGRLLNQHPDIAVGIERFSQLCAARRLTAGHFEETRFFDLQPGDTWYTSLDRFDRDYAAVRPKYAAARYVGDIFPRGFQHLDHLGALFPDIRIVFCFQDPLEVANFFEERRRGGIDWPPDRDHRAAVDFWNRSVAEAQRWIGYLPILPVHCADLQRYPRIVLERVARFLDVDPAPLFAAARLRRFAVPQSALTAEARAAVTASANFGGLEALMNYAARPIASRAAAPDLGVNLNDHVTRYDREDREIIDYHVWKSPACRFGFRGPAPEAPPEESIVFLGSAATAGRFVERPAAALIAERMNVPTINLGFGGARPGMYLNEPYVRDMLQRCRLAVVEVMSARGYATSVFTPLNQWTNLGEKAPFVPHVKNFSGQQHTFVDHVYDTVIAACDFVDLARVLAEIRLQYIIDMKEIANLTHGRNLLFYFSRRAPDYHARPYGWMPWSGDFPHFVDANLLAILRNAFSGYAEVVSTTGLPQRLVNRHTGAPIEVYPPTNVPSANTYYPSPEMHEEAAEALLPLIAARLAGN